MCECKKKLLTFGIDILLEEIYKMNGSMREG